MEFALLYLYSYLVGSIPTAYVLGRLVKGIDIREYGSGNVGASNVFQHVGRWWALFLGAFEVFVKGASPVWLGIVLLDIPVQGPAGSWTINYLLGFDRSSAALAMASLLSIAGHNWSIFLKFQGGRGLGTAAGGLLAMGFYQLWINLAMSLLGVYFFKRSAIVTLVAVLLLPFWTILLGQSYTVVWYCCGIIGLVLLKRLIANGRPEPSELSIFKVIFNRLVRDRDVDSREEWVHRVPDVTNGRNA